MLLVGSGCADRGLASGPASPTGTGTWLVVGAAASAAIAVLAALVVLPSRRPGGSSFAAWLLAVEAGAVLVGGAVIVGAALRTGDLVTQPDRTEQAASLLRLTGLDGGDTGFFPLVAAVTAVLGLLLLVVLGLAARCAANDDPIERGLATAVLAAEAVASGVAAAFVVLGEDILPVTLSAGALPLLVGGVVAVWPRRRIGYNEVHG
ncbi:MAG: hypothetical protein ABIP36_09235 [Acidimicrobiales bacterium]